MDSRYRIVRARQCDVPALPSIEAAATELLRDFASASVLSESTSEAVFLEAQRDRRLWVALRGDVPVGFALTRRLGPRELHLEELDVHPDHGRRGLGGRLLETVCNWATRAGYHEVTLTTFRHVPWNMPFYASRGFEVVPVNQLDTSLVSIVAAETRRGLDPYRRVVMRRRTYLAALTG